MEDLLVKYAPQFATITALAMVLTEFIPLPIGKMADKNAHTFAEKNGTRRPISALIYSTIFNLLGWVAGVLVHVPEPPEGVHPMVSGAAFLLLMSFLSVATAHGLVKGKRAIAA